MASQDHQDAETNAPPPLVTPSIDPSAVAPLMGWAPGAQEGQPEYFHQGGQSWSEQVVFATGTSYLAGETTAPIRACECVLLREPLCAFHVLLTAYYFFVSCHSTVQAPSAAVRLVLGKVLERQVAA